jgi:hypothetical protein
MLKTGVGIEPTHKGKVCNSKSQAAFSAEILGKYDATYFRCEACGFMQVETAVFWIHQAKRVTSCAALDN